MRLHCHNTIYSYCSACIVLDIICVGSPVLHYKVSEMVAMMMLRAWLLPHKIGLV